MTEFSDGASAMRESAAMGAERVAQHHREMSAHWENVARWLRESELPLVDADATNDPIVVKIRRLIEASRNRKAVISRYTINHATGYACLYEEEL